MKHQRIAIRINNNEKKYLTAKAKESGLAVSEYIRARIFEEDNNEITKKTSPYRKAMTHVNVMGYFLIGKLARKQLSDEEIQEATDRTNEILNNYNMGEKK